MTLDDDKAKQQPSIADLVSEYLRLRELGEPDAATQVLAKCHGFVRREVEKSIALYEDLEDIGRLGRDEEPNPPKPRE